MKQKLIVGLGNPGNSYYKTRHNAGFLIVDYLLQKYGFEKKTIKFNAEIFITKINNVKVIFLKPLTYMNLSGEALNKTMSFFKIDKKDILVIHDDKDLDVAVFRFKNKGSSGGHNGLKNIISHLGSEEFKRIKVGVGKPINNIKIIDWVLMKLKDEEINLIINNFKLREIVIEDFISETDINKIMNKFN
ncbi:peptidyl-tRNA hydrolase [Spiroplasma corruscae]|uniref:Peptidyl-tRNA hydrolase n=1 Tax=Spiroplasma corruscae TaxID=216934 RepID=A0A222EQF9_9MOLU|nr:aminoacyl-tRNA hydrolase [Spiroplasma corruscae]ASP28758.1 peptidyl-tRNA hydrolase [Spiroplasma corruscae]